MFGRKRFYCIECEHFLDRHCVTTSEYDYRFYCRYCGNPVVKTALIRQKMEEDYIKYLVEKNTDMEVFQSD